MADIQFGLNHNPPTYDETPGRPMDDSWAQGVTGQVQSAPTAPSAPASDNSWVDPVVAQSRPQQVRAPEAYYPSSLSVVSSQQDESGWKSVARFMMDLGTQPGEMPTSAKLRFAEAETKHKLNTDQLAWQNFQYTQQVHRDLLRKQTEDNKVQVLNMLPHHKAMMRAEPDLELRYRLGEKLGALSDSLVPGSGQMYRDFAKEPFYNDMMDALAGNEEYGEPVRKLIDRVGPDNALHNNEMKRVLDVFGHDAVGIVAGHFDKDSHKALLDGKMNEETFRKKLKETMYDPQGGLTWTPQLATAVESFLATPEGELAMIGHGVETNKIKQHKAEKEKVGVGDFMKGEQEIAYKERKAIIEDSKKPGNENKYQPKYIAELEDDQRIALQLKSKESSPGVNPNNSVVQRFDINTKGKYGKYEDIDKLPPGPLKDEAYAAQAKARKEQDTYGPQAQLAKQMETPVDISKIDLYSKKDIRAGQLRKRSVPLSEYQKRTDPDLFEADPKFIAGMTKLQIAKTQGNVEMFDVAAKAFKAKDATGLSAQWAKWKALELGGVAAAAVSADPANADLVTYHDTFTAWAGKDARALGDEVGTMTDADRLVWKDTFPKPTDPPAIQKAKRGLFNRMIQVIYDVNAAVAVGDDPELLKKAMDKKAGTVGQIKQELSKLKGSTPANSKESTPKPKAGVHSLMEDLEAGK